MMVARAPAVYATIYAIVRDKAREMGYAVGLHGSMQKDLDLILVPWTETASPEYETIMAICETIGGFMIRDGTLGGRWDVETKQMVEAVIRNPEEKPHGRRAWAIQLGGGSYLDLSVMPRVSP